MKDRALSLSLAALFLILGSFLLHLPGIQADEALFAGPLFHPKVPPVEVRLVFTHIPAMCFPYIGAIKTGLYALIWRVFEPSPASVHFPAVCLGALSVYIFARLLQRLNQPPWAALLLATDATYLFTLRSDWGPTALQHLFALTGAYAGLRFAQTGHWRWVAAAGFLFGLGFWDKITFLWILFALTVAVLATARHLIKPLPVIVLAVTFLAGCYPLLVFNYKTGGASFQGNAALDTGPVWIKGKQLLQALGVQNIFHAGGEHALPPVQPVTPVAAALSKFDYTFPLQPSLFLAALLAAPWLWRSRHYRFCLIALIAGYGYMFALRNAGSGVHHTVLLWPLPHLLIACLPLRRWMVAAVVLTNLLTINHIYAQLQRRELSVEWSDASTALAARLKGDPRTYRILDWGIFDTLHLINRGKTNLFIGAAPPGEPARYISHVPHLLLIPIDSDKTGPLIVEETISDSAGRPVFVISRNASVNSE